MSCFVAKDKCELNYFLLYVAWRGNACALIIASVSSNFLKAVKNEISWWLDKPVIHVHVLDINAALNIIIKDNSILNEYKVNMNSLWMCMLYVSFKN